jgi:hypothetical protein
VPVPLKTHTSTLPHRMLAFMMLLSCLRTNRTHNFLVHFDWRKGARGWILKFFENRNDRKSGPCHKVFIRRTYVRKMHAAHDVSLYFEFSYGGHGMFFHTNKSQLHIFMTYGFKTLYGMARRHSCVSLDIIDASICGYVRAASSYGRMQHEYTRGMQKRRKTCP